MKRQGVMKMKALERFLGLLVLAAIFAGCTDNRQSFFVRDIKIPSEEDCIVQSDRNTPFRPYGLLDLAFGGGYFMHPLLENAMTSSEKLSPVTAESNRISVTGAEVSIELENGTPITDEPFFAATSAIVEPGGVTATSFEAIPLGMLTEDRVSVGDVILIRFRMLGVTGGGKEVDTPRFTFPVYTCGGCLVYFPPEAWDSDRECYDCCDVGSGGDMTIPCNAGQDQWVDCRLCAGGWESLCWDDDCPCG